MNITLTPESSGDYAFYVDLSPGVWYSLNQCGSNLSISGALGTYTFTLDLTAYEAGTGTAVYGYYAKKCFA